MPITFEIQASERTVYTTVTGPLLDADPVQYLSDVFEHPAYRPGFSALVVCKNVTIGAFSTPAIQRLAAFSREMERRLRGSRVAIVADQPVVFGVARMYQLLRDPPYRFQVFRKLPEAEAWLESGAQTTDG